MTSQDIVVGNTKLIQVDGIYAKLECTNPCGSIKDRMVKYILDESEKRGLFKPGMRVVEATSGNTGIALTYYAKKKGYDVTIVMPENMTEERKHILKVLGANTILCSEQGSIAEAMAIRDDILARDPNYFTLDQFSNPLNAECHYKTTGQEILAQIKDYTSNTTDAFVAGVGTGGSLIGVTKALKEANPQLHVAAVEPRESAVMSGGEPGPHGIQGIGDGFVPPIATGGNQPLHELIDEVICVSTEEAKSAAKYTYEKHGLCIGMSSGANYVAAKRIAERFKTVVTIFPDGFSLYGSLGLIRGEKRRCPFEKYRVNVLSSFGQDCLITY
ncbi:PLP-dependent cysteine synthase family protein [Chloroflexota bacterium]